MEAGRYRARALSASFGESKAKGTPFVAVKFQLTDTKEEITYFGYFTDKTKERSIQALMAAGWDGRDPESLDGLGSVECQLVIIEEPDNMDPSKIWKRVQYVNKLDSGPQVKPMDAGKSKALFAGLRATAAALAAKEKADDVPF